MKTKNGAKQMKKNEIMFRIDQLKKDRIIYALTSIALSFISEIFYFFFALATGSHSITLVLICMMIPFCYFLYFVVLNNHSAKKIKELEELL